MDSGKAAPYGIRWGKSPKGSTIHLMQYSKYSKTFTTRCGRGYGKTIFATNVYLKAKACSQCTNWIPTSNGFSQAFKADWAHYTDPATGRTKRERHK